MLTATSWAENRHYLLALDYFNHGYYWEAHEEWERLWRASGPDTAVGKFLKGLVKLSAAGVKVRENSIHGVRRHAASAGEVFADVAAEVGTEHYCGLEFILLQFAADRAAQIAYNERTGTPHEPTRVFPFVLTITPMPLD
jgi:predicted metal-dependent hydrolase